MKDICETLFEPLRTGDIVWQDKRILFLNAQDCNFLQDMARDQIVLQQGFKPFSDVLTQKKFFVVPEIPKGEAFDLVLMLFPKNVVEGRYAMARALMMLPEQGVLLCAAENKAGGTRLKKIFAEFGLNNIQELSKNKAKAVWAVAKNPDIRVIESCVKDGVFQNILGGDFISRPGLFGWDKIDKGSEILAPLLPLDLKGKGADFGCGYGYLARNVLERSQNIKNLICADADFRAVEACRINLEGYATKTTFLWCDLTKPQNEIKNLDFIIMNPPFHEGKKTDVGVGVSFIQNAARSLRFDGDLWMVANAHLPYESALNENFKMVKKIAEKGGFKILRAQKG